MALPALGPLFAQLVRMSVPTLGRMGVGEAVAGTGGRAVAGAGARAAAAGAVGGSNRIAHLFNRLAKTNVPQPPAGAAAMQPGGHAARAAQQAKQAGQSAANVANNVSRGQQQTSNSLATGLKNVGDVMQASLRDGFRDIAKQMDMSAIFQRQGGPNRERQAEIARLRGEVAGHGSMMGQSLAPQDLQAKLADLEAMEEKDKALHEQANQELKGAVKKMAGAMLMGVGAVAALPLAGRKFAEAMTAANESLRQFNGTVANAYANLDRTNLQMKYQQAGATAGSSATLANSMAALRREFAPINSSVNTMKNLISVGVVQSLRGMLIGVKTLVAAIPFSKAAAEALEAIEELLEGNKPHGDFMTFMDRVQSGEFIPNRKDPNWEALARNEDPAVAAARKRAALKRRGF